MASEAPSETVVVVRKRPLGWRIAKWTAIALAVLVVLAGAFLLWLNTEAGHRFIVDRINAMETTTGLKIRVGRIEGSIYSRLTLHEVTLSDPQGNFATAPRAELEYRPLPLLFGGRFDIREVDIPEARLIRSPALRPGDPNAPLLPDITLDIARLHVGRLSVDPRVTGRRHLVSLDGQVRLNEGRALVTLDAGTIVAPGLAGGDRLRLLIDAVPAANRLNIAVNLRAPGDGFIAGLAGIDRPVMLVMGGNGTWANWRGRAVATLDGQALANLQVTARDGTFEADGLTRPGLVLTGPVQRLAEPAAMLHASGRLVQRRADLRVRLYSRAFAAAAEGRIDLGNNRYEELRVAARLLRPGAIAPDLSGQDVRLALVLNGPFALPEVLYDLRAARLTMADSSLEGLQASGHARVRADDIVVPVRARAARLTGFDAIAGGTITNVTLAGELGVTGTRLVSDNMFLRSDRIDARLVLAFDLSRGRYLAALQGRVDNYLVDGVGLFAVNADFDLTQSPAGFGLRGRVAARTRRITNETVAQLLGGPGTLAAGIVMDPSGLVHISNIRLSAPALRVTSGQGVYRPNGSLDIRVAGVSTDYGPLAVRVSGAASTPRVEVAAASPGYGLAGIRAVVRPTREGWALTAEGGSRYGPFSADIVIQSNRRPFTILVNRLTYAGVDFRGTLVRTAAGPFQGTLAFSGSGLTGTATLAAAGRRQRIDLVADANGARTPGDNPIIIQRGFVRAGILLPSNDDETIDLDADAQLAGLSADDLLVQRARVHVNLRGGVGDGQLFAEGRRGVPFRVAAAGRRTGDEATLAMQGHLNNIGFRFAQPAALRREGKDWVMQPTTINLQQGRVRLAGRYGEGLTIQARLDELDLSVLNAFSPGLGIGGRATGSLDFHEASKGAFPRAEARLNITGFTRTGIAVRSSPVDLFIAGRLVPEGGEAGAIIRRGGAIIGRAQARLQPLGPAAGSWQTRLFAAPLSGGVRYNGPADVPMSFASLPGHQLTGPVGIAADFGGRVQSPQFTGGVLRSTNLTYVNEAYGTRITNLAVNGRFDQSQLVIESLTGRAGNGTIEGRGTIGLASAAGFPIDLRVSFQNARLARSDDISATATGNLHIVNNASGALIEGELNLGEVRYQLVQQAAAEIPQLAGVRRRGEPLRPPNEQSADARVPSIWRLDIRLIADNRIYVSGMGMESEWRAEDLRVTGTTATAQFVGQVRLIRGTLGLAGRRFRLDDGTVVFAGARPPRIELAASSTIDNVDVGINVSGSSTNPRIAFTSTPGLPQDEIVSRILFGSSVTQISAIQAVQLAASLNSLRGGSGGLNPLGRLRSATGIDRLRIIDADTATGRGTAVAAGMYLSDDIYVEIITDAKGYTATQIEISLSRTLSLLSQFGTNSGTNVNIRYNRDY
ncbi:MAG TPA: translocation/assembly module TamB domain-containing protein [Allosphingosinicella sp.]|nr:translocation/assembly module TamB domain-containing protein [Allosphingosinicella sp.]